MTGVDMNVFARKNLTLAAVVALCAASGGCGTALTARTADDSPLSERIRQVVDANRSYPRWADFPAAPTNVPDGTDISQRVAGLSRSAEAASRAAAAIEWTLDDPQTYAAEVRSRMNATRMAPGTARTAEEVEAFARALRERAVPPPPIDPR